MNIQQQKPDYHSLTFIAQMGGAKKQREKEFSFTEEELDVYIPEYQKLGYGQKEKFYTRVGETYNQPWYVIRNHLFKGLQDRGLA